MRFKFLDWYTQALGSTIGILACIYAYLNGYMFVYGNIDGHFDHLGFGGVISSYILLPLCLINLFLSLAKSYTIKKEILNTSFESINIFISILTIIIGFTGAKIYFLMPSILILFNILDPAINNSKILENQKKLFDTKKEDNIIQETIKFDKIHVDIFNESNTASEIEGFYESKSNEADIIEIKKEIALQLLRKKSSKQFIVELTGFTLDEINTLEKEFGINNI